MSGDASPQPQPGRPGRFSALQAETVAVDDGLSRPLANPLHVPLLGELRAARVSPPTRRSILRGLLMFRWLAFAWFAAVFGWEVATRSATPQAVANAEVGFVLVAATVALLVVLTEAFRGDPELLIKPTPLLAEIALVSLLLGADVYVYGTIDKAQTLPSVFPVAVVFGVAIAAGGRAAVVTGFGLGLAHYVGWLAGPEIGLYSLAHLSTIIQLAGVGWLAAYWLDRMADADRSIQTYRAREEVALTLHDGVLQTLAVIQRRSEDPALVDLARSQEYELRNYLFGVDETPVDLATALRDAGHRAEQRYGVRVEVVCAPDLPETEDRILAAIVGAVTEALANAGKHAAADRIVVYAEPETSPEPPSAEQVFVSIKDDGAGFEPDTITPGQGLTGSIAKRIGDIGGRVEIDGRPGRGAEVRVWAPTQMP